MSTGAIRHPAAAPEAIPAHPDGLAPKRLERITPRQASYLHNVGGVDRPLPEVALGWGEDAIEGVVVSEERF